MKWGSAAGRLPSPWTTSTRKTLGPSNGVSSSNFAVLESVIWSRKVLLWNGTWQTGSTSIVREARQRRTNSLRLAFADGRIGSKKPRLRRGNLCPLVCISSPRCFFCSSWWCVGPEDDKEETSGHRSSPMNMRCDASTDFLVNPFSFTITDVDPNIAGKMVGESNNQLFSWHWPGTGESILPIVMSVVDTTIWLIVNPAIACLPDDSRKFRPLWGCREDRNGAGGQ